MKLQLHKVTLLALVTACAHTAPRDPVANVVTYSPACADIGAPPAGNARAWLSLSMRAGTVTVDWMTLGQHDRDDVMLRHWSERADQCLHPEGR